MFIVRNGFEIELTEEELRNAADAYDKRCHGEDVMSYYEDHCDTDFPGDEEEAEEIGEEAMRILSKTDGYWEYFWEAIRQAIKAHYDIEIS